MVEESHETLVLSPLFCIKRVRRKAHHGRGVLREADSDQQYIQSAIDIEVVSLSQTPLMLCLPIPLIYVAAPRTPCIAG